MLRIRLGFCVVFAAGVCVGFSYSCLLFGGLICLRCLFACAIVADCELPVLVVVYCYFCDCLCYCFLLLVALDFVWVTYIFLFGFMLWIRFFCLVLCWMFDLVCLNVLLFWVCCCYYDVMLCYMFVVCFFCGLLVFLSVVVLMMIRFCLVSACTCLGCLHVDTSALLMDCCLFYAYWMVYWLVCCDLLMCFYFVLVCLILVFTLICFGVR